MISLSRSERYTILFLSGCIILGLGVTYARSHMIRKDIIIHQTGIPHQGEPVAKEYKKVNINSDDFEALCSLPAIGPGLAKRIITHRSEFGSYRRIDDIKKVKGIGSYKYNIIKDLICVE
ncbi:MAG: helix-hairpin-helix domain-containing protein [Candidatus Omnitrophota bacterium]